MHTTSLHYIVCFRRCEPTTSEPFVRYRIIPMSHYTSFATSSKTVLYCMQCRTYDKQETVKSVWYRTFYGYIVLCTNDVVKKQTISLWSLPYTTLYTISQVQLARTSILTYDIVRRTYDIVYDIVCIVYDICMNRTCLVRIIKHHCLYRPWPIPVSSRRQWLG